MYIIRFCCFLLFLLFFTSCPTDSGIEGRAGGKCHSDCTCDDGAICFEGNCKDISCDVHHQFVENCLDQGDSSEILKQGAAIRKICTAAIKNMFVECEGYIPSLPRSGCDCIQNSLEDYVGAKYHNCSNDSGGSNSNDASDCSAYIPLGLKVFLDNIEVSSIQQSMGAETVGNELLCGEAEIDIAIEIKGDGCECINNVRLLHNEDASIIVDTPSEGEKLRDLGDCKFSLTNYNVSFGKTNSSIYAIKTFAEESDSSRNMPALFFFKSIEADRENASCSVLFSNAEDGQGESVWEYEKEQNDDDEQIDENNIPDDNEIPDTVNTNSDAYFTSPSNGSIVKESTIFMIKVNNASDGDASAGMYFYEGGVKVSDRIELARQDSTSSFFKATVDMSLWPGKTLIVKSDIYFSNGNKTIQVDELIVNVCQPQCLGKDCGDDSCGGSCGDCLISETCSDYGQCESNFPNYYAERYWSDVLEKIMSTNDAEDACENIGGNLPTISELRILIKNCSNTMENGACKLEDSCSWTGDDCWSSDCKGCDEDSTGKYNGFGDYDAFWSSSNKDFIYSWYVNFNNAGIYSADHLNQARVRCIKPK